MRKPVFVQDIAFLGKWYWCEIEGFEKVARRQSGYMIFLENEIMGWKCLTLGEILKKQKEVSFSPRIRYWESENENDEPTAEERAASGWDNVSRLWVPNIRDMMIESHEAEYLQNGRTVWEDENNGENTNG